MVGFNGFRRRGRWLVPCRSDHGFSDSAQGFMGGEPDWMQKQMAVNSRQQVGPSGSNPSMPYRNRGGHTVSSASQRRNKLQKLFKSNSLSTELKRKRRATPTTRYGPVSQYPATERTRATVGDMVTEDPLEGSSSSRGYGKGNRDDILRSVPERIESRKDLRPHFEDGLPSIWVIGDSVVHKAHERAMVKYFGGQLGIDVNEACIRWFGKDDMCWDELLPTVKTLGLHSSPPMGLIMHLGNNSLLNPKCSRLEFSNMIKSDLSFLKRSFPNTKIVWSKMLPLPGPIRIIKSRKDVNRVVFNFCKLEGIEIIYHKKISSLDTAYFDAGYYDDKKHLTSLGYDVFNETLQAVVERIVKEAPEWYF